MTYTTNNTASVKLSKVEERILAALGGRPWQAADLTDEAVCAARAELRRLRRAAGFSGGRWFTDSTTSPKLAKSDFPTVGVTLHAAIKARKVWTGLAAQTQQALAAVLDVDTDTVLTALSATMCPHSTPGCVWPCVASESANSKVDGTPESRLIRTLFHMFRPELAFALTGDGLRKLHAEHGDDCRWRVNISDDVRWELLAPGLLDLGVRGYAYTKWSPAERPDTHPRLSVVYSATERTSTETIVELTSKGLRSAVVFDAKPGELPIVWNGLTVINGDKTDDLWRHPAGTVVGLSAKAPTLELKEHMRRSGFARAV